MKYILSFFLFLSTTSYGWTPVSTMHFSGTLEHTEISRSQLARLDLIHTAGDGDSAQYMAILVLPLGDFKSHEYISYHFEKVKFSPGQGEMVLERTDQDIDIKVEEVSTDGMEIRGTVRSALGAKVIGRLRVRRDGDVKPQYPLLQALHGEYAGKCGKREAAIQIKTYRAQKGEVNLSGNPFATYDIHALFAEPDARLETTCPKWMKRPCMKHMWEGSYRLDKNRIKFFGSGPAMNCTPSERGLDCGACQFRRVTFSANPKEMAPRFSKEEESKALSSSEITAANLEGEYSGYIYHKSRDLYQRVKLSLFVTEGKEGDLHLSATAGLIFGDWESLEILPYQFDEVTLKKGEPNGPLVFSNAGKHQDGVLQVESLQSGVIQGNWFSLLFGRVGPVTLVKGEEPKAPQGAEVMPSMSGVYRWMNFDGIGTRLLHYNLYVSVIMGHQKVSLSNPYAPLSFASYYLTEERAFPLKHFNGGSYDFYTGRIVLGDLWAGTFRTRREFEAGYVAQNITTPLYHFEGSSMDFLYSLND